MIYVSPDTNSLTAMTASKILIVISLSGENAIEDKIGDQAADAMTLPKTGSVSRFQRKLEIIP